MDRLNKRVWIDSILRVWMDSRRHWRSTLFIKFEIWRRFFLLTASNFGAKIQINVKQKKWKQPRFFDNFHLSKCSVAEFSVTITTPMQEWWKRGFNLPPPPRPFMFQHSFERQNNSILLHSGLNPALHFWCQQDFLAVWRWNQLKIF